MADSGGQRSMACFSPGFAKSRTWLSNWTTKTTEEEENRYEKTFEDAIVKTFTDLEKEIGIEIQKAQRFQHRINSWRNTPRHILIKLTKIKFKGKTLKGAREK